MNSAEAPRTFEAARDRNPSAPFIRLRDAADVEVARQLRDALLTAESRPAIVDCSELERLGAPVLQVVIAYLRESGINALELSGAAEGFDEYCRVGGFDHHLQRNPV